MEFHPEIIPHTRGALRKAHVEPARDGDHPRIRGEHLGERVLAEPVDGIIPAYAGSTKPCLILVLDSWGSSPHTRGALLERAAVGAVLGIIPAYAESTFLVTPFESLAPGSSPHTRGAHGLQSKFSAATRDHPRIRGEHPRYYYPFGRLDGIIPAYAGSTWHIFRRCHGRKGSSPHTRGAHQTRPT